MEKVLVISPSWIGDAMIADSLFRLLRNQFPSANVDALATQPVVANLLRKFSSLDEIIECDFPRGHFCLKQRFEVAKSIAARNYTRSIVLPNSWKSALVPFFASIPIRTGYLGEMRYFLLNDIRKEKPNQPRTRTHHCNCACSCLPEFKNNEREVESRSFRINESNKNQLIQKFSTLSYDEILPANISYPELSTQKSSAKETFARLFSSPDFARLSSNKILAMCIGSEYGPAKCWPLKYFAEIAKQKHSEGYSVLILGSKKDIENANTINNFCSNVCINLAGRTSISDVVDCLSLSTIVLTNDSGLMHISAALNIPLVSIFGSTSPDITPPLSKNNNSRVLFLKNLPCRPCFKRKCHLGHFKCMINIVPEFILKELKELEDLSN